MLKHIYSYPGIIQDSELNFSTAMNDAYAKFAFRLYTLGMIRKHISDYTVLTIVKSMFIMLLP